MATPESIAGTFALVTIPDRLARERAFHDELAAMLVPEQMPHSVPGGVDRAFLEYVGDVRGKEVLDLGCGSGDLTLELAAAGASVTGLDVSPRMVSVADRRLSHFLPDHACQFVVAAAENTGLPADNFDLVVGRYVVHHLDIAEGSAEIRRLLRPGGRAVFLETWGGNPVLMFARDHLAGRFGIPRYGTADEHPLDDAQIEALARSFERVRTDFPTFEFFGLFDRQILRYRFPRLSRPCQAADRFVYRRLPRLRRFSFRVVVALEM